MTEFKKQIHCKLTFNDQIRRFIFNGTEFAELRGHISNILSLPPDGFVLKYVDNESELITLSSTEDLILAIELSDKLLRLVVENPSIPPISSLPSTYTLSTPLSSPPTTPLVDPSLSHSGHHGFGGGHHPHPHGHGGMHGGGHHPHAHDQQGHGQPGHEHHGHDHQGHHPHHHVQPGHDHHGHDHQASWWKSPSSPPFHQGQSGNDQPGHPHPHGHHPHPHHDGGGMHGGGHHPHPWHHGGGMHGGGHHPHPWHHGGGMHGGGHHGGWHHGGGDYPNFDKKEKSRLRIQSKIDFLKKSLEQIEPTNDWKRQGTLMKINRLEHRLLRWDANADKKMVKRKQKEEKKWDKKLSPEALTQVQTLKSQIATLKPVLYQLKVTKKAKKSELELALQTGQGDKENIWSEILRLKESIHETQKQISSLKDQIHAILG